MSEETEVAETSPVIVQAWNLGTSENVNEFLVWLESFVRFTEIESERATSCTVIPNYFTYEGRECLDRLSELALSAPNELSWTVRHLRLCSSQTIAYTSLFIYPHVLAAVLQLFKAVFACDQPEDWTISVRGGSITGDFSVNGSCYIPE